MNDKRTNYMKIFQVWKVIGLVLLICLIGILLYSYFFPLILIHIPIADWLIVDEENSLSILQYTWSVQGALAAISIALLTLLVGFIKEEIYGVRFLEYVTVERPRSRFRMNIWEETVMIIVLTGISYIFVAKVMMATAVFIFFITIILIIDLIYRVIYFFVFSEKSVARVREILLQSVLDSIEKENRG